ncbi:MAG: hypothetical protein AB7O96_02920 [Pseudobdellovibrionaceae bacterium]
MITLKQVLFCCLVLLQSLWSLQLNDSDFRVIENPLVIETRKTQPPFAAFENLESQPAWEESWTALDNLNDTFESLNHKAKEKKVAKTSTVERIEEMVISKADFEFSPQQVVALEEMPIESPQVPQQIAQMIAENEPTLSSSPPSRDWLKDLTPKQRDRLIQAHQSHGTLDEDWSLPSTDSLIEQKFQEIVSVERAKEQKVSLPSTGVTVSSEYGNQGVPKPKYLEDFDSNSPAEPNHTVASRTGVDAGAESSGNVFITGPFELSGGLAMTDKMHVELRRFEDGISKEAGKIDVKTGRFEIGIERSVGTLIATLSNEKGQTVGRGAYRLSHLPFSLTDKKSIENLTLRLTPTVSGVLGRAISANSFSGQKIIAKNAKVEIESLEQNIETEATTGVFKFEDLSGKSLALAKLEAKGFVSSQALLGSGDEQPVLMFPQEKIEALYSLLKETHEFIPLKEGGNIIWGRVSQDGRAVAGIDISVDGYQDLKAIYFNEIGIPDPALKATSGSGAFVFLDVAEGFQSLTAAKGKTYLGHLNVVVAGGYISSGDVNIGGFRDNIDVKVFDAFLGESRPAEVALQSFESEFEVDVSGLKTVTIPQVNRSSLAWVDPGQPYAPALYHYNDKDDFIHLPLINLDWLTALRQAAKIADSIEVGTVIGFVDEAFEVFLSNGSRYHPGNVVFFDSVGNKVTKPVAGGGFIMFDVPNGTQSIVVVTENNSEIESRVTTVESGRLSVLQFRSLN